MASWWLTLLILSFVFRASKCAICSASVCALGDNWLTSVTVSYDGRTFEPLSTKSTVYHDVMELSISNISPPTLLRFEVDGSGGNDGFIATVIVQCDEDYDATYITDQGNTYFDVIDSMHGTLEMSEFTPFGTGSWWHIGSDPNCANENSGCTYVACMDSRAYWMWNGVSTDDIVFELDLFPNIFPPLQSPSTTPTAPTPTAPMDIQNTNINARHPLAGNV